MKEENVGTSSSPHAAGDKWADRAGAAIPDLFSFKIQNPKSKIFPPSSNSKSKIQNPKLKNAPLLPRL
jgi:hypothetical protein